MSFNRPVTPSHIQYIHILYIHGALSLLFFPFAPPLYPLLLIWHPPAVTGIVHLSLRLLIN